MNAVRDGVSEEVSCGISNSQRVSSVMGGCIGIRAVVVECECAIGASDGI